MRPGAATSGAVDLVLALGELAAVVPSSLTPGTLRRLAKATASSCSDAIEAEGAARSEMGRLAARLGGGGSSVDAKFTAALASASSKLDATQVLLARALTCRFRHACLELVVTAVPAPSQLAEWGVLDIPMCLADAFAANPACTADAALHRAFGAAREFAREPVLSPASPGGENASPVTAPEGPTDAELAQVPKSLALVALAVGSMVSREGAVARLAGWVALETAVGALDAGLGMAAWRCAGGPEARRSLALSLVAVAGLRTGLFLVSRAGRARALAGFGPACTAGVGAAVMAASVLATPRGPDSTGATSRRTPKAASAGSAPVSGLGAVPSSGGGGSAGDDVPAMAARFGQLVHCLVASDGPGDVVLTLSSAELGRQAAVVAFAAAALDSGPALAHSPDAGAALAGSLGEAAGACAAVQAALAPPSGAARGGTSSARERLGTPAPGHGRGPATGGAPVVTVKSFAAACSDAAAVCADSLRCTRPARARARAEALAALGAALRRPLEAARAAASGDPAWSHLAGQVGLDAATSAGAAREIRALVLRRASSALRGRPKRADSHWRRSLYAALACCLPAGAWLAQAEEEWIATEAAVDCRCFLLDTAAGLVRQGGCDHDDDDHAGSFGPSGRSGSLAHAARLAVFAGEQDASAAVRLAATAALASVLASGDQAVPVATRWDAQCCLLSRLADADDVATEAAAALASSAIGGILGCAATAQALLAARTAPRPGDAALWARPFASARPWAAELAAMERRQVLGAVTSVVMTAWAGAAVGSRGLRACCRQMRENTGRAGHAARRPAPHPVCDITPLRAFLPCPPQRRRSRGRQLPAPARRVGDMAGGGRGHAARRCRLLQARSARRGPAHGVCSRAGVRRAGGRPAAQGGARHQPRHGRREVVPAGDARCPAAQRGAGPRRRGGWGEGSDAALP